MAAHEEEPPLAAPVPAAVGALRVYAGHGLDHVGLIAGLVLYEIVDAHAAVWFRREGLVGDAHVTRCAPHGEG